MAEAELKALISKRAHVKSHMTRFINFVNNLEENKNAMELEVRLTKFEETWSEFKKIQSAIESIDDSDSQLSEQESFENKYFEIVSRARQYKQNVNIANTTTGNVPPSNLNADINNCNVRLPVISLPEFNGCYEGWLQFFETFKSLIHNNSSLSNIQKFYYLRSCTKGEASRVFHALEVSDANYLVAWQLLKDRYENKRVIIHSHVKGIFDMPNLTKESHIHLRKLIDNVLRHTRSLKSLGQNVEHWDTLLIYVISSKLDPQTKREWETSIKKDIIPSFADLLNFLTNKCQLLETLDNKMAIRHIKDFTGSSLSHVTTENNQYTNSCRYCKGQHYIFKCDKLLSLPVNARFKEIKKLKLCINCLRKNHLVDSCLSRGCKICNKQHNTILHFDSETTPDTQKTSNISPSQQGELGTQTTTVVSHCMQNNLSQVILSTAIVNIYDANNQAVKCRALLDSGSQSNFMTSELCERLNLKGSKINMPVSGINQTSLNIHYKIQASIQATDKSYKTKLNFLVINSITGNIPQYSFETDNLNIPKDIHLADPDFNHSSKIDILLGATIFFNLLQAGQIMLGHNNPILQNTKLGWVISGPFQPCLKNTQTSCLLSTNDINEQLERFWQVESIDNPSNKLSNEELECEIHFRENFEQDNTGRCTVKLPFKETYKNLGNSLDVALNRFKSLENKLARDSNLKKQYSAFLHEYQILGHMSKIDITHDNSDIKNYLPHHAVFKDSTTTKLRVVFDGSAKTSTGISLNDVLKVGPTVQNDLFDIVLRMRTHNIVITADITKMYRQINVHENDRDFQRIIWRSNPDLPICHYKLNTVTYGTASASFLATRTIHQIGLNNKVEFPLASKAIINDFYVDDLITGSPNLQEAIQLKEDINNILLKSGFELRKWVSNNPLVFNVSNSKSDLTQYQIKDNKETKTLGILWDSESDIFQYAINLNLSNDNITKRSILSIIAKIFDPLGLISPVVVAAKLILQQLWQLHIDWDDTIPNNLQASWIEFIDQIKNINTIKIPRNIMLVDSIIADIHGFCDASISSYGSCIYLHTQNQNGEITTRLICAKSRIAPLKTISLPRLELCGALLLAKLMQKTKNALCLNFNQTFYWTDSTIVLAWLSAPPNKWKTFVSNRIAEIQNLSETHSWKHVKSEDNPADLVSRGVNPNELKDSTLWWHGPSWLTKPTKYWPQGQSINIASVPEARKENILLSFHSAETLDIFSRYSTFNKLQRVMAYILRFIHNLKSRDNRITGLLSTMELDNSVIKLSHLVQAQEFENDIKSLKQSKFVSKTSKLVSLNPFIDSNGLIRVGGRIKNSLVSYNQKHPILLPSKHLFTKLLIKHEHHKNLHAGAQFVLSCIRSQFWPLNGKNAVRSVLRNCVTCFRVNPLNINPLMGDLPEMRVTPARPFSCCGIDYAGPYLIKDGKTRSRSFIKAYLCIFICLSTKAVHIELVTDLTSEAFMNSFKRFVSRRGLCRHIYTDNATNFVGANNELQKIYKLVSNISKNENSQLYFANNQINWHFIPARSPHFGGIWESAVKSFKYHLKRVIGNARLNFEDMYTILTQIEAILNSRPLIPLSNDPTDLHPLTPGHFLIGDSLLATPQENTISINPNRLNSYKKLQQSVQQFWLWWSKDYLHSLQQRSKWKVRKDKCLLGSLVLLKDDCTAPLNWQLGRIISTHPGNDGTVRVVTVRTATSVVKRAVNRVCLLPNDDLQEA